MVKVKICGLTCLEDALAALKSGADFLGFVVEIKGAKRAISRKEAGAIFKALRGKIPLVVLTDLLRGEEIAGLGNELLPDAVQLVKDLPPEEVLQLKADLPGLKIFKTLQVKDRSACLQAKEWEKAADFLVLDSLGLGGSGKTADWEICAKIRRNAKIPVFLAGGLNPENLEQAIKKVNPFGVDVSSGVKLKEDCRKIDLIKLEQFVKKAKEQC